ncbi:MAG: vWA domain-containing protein [Bacteroidota bacterium]|jgi:hypothetical protein
MAAVAVDQKRVEALGPAEQIVQTLTQTVDHAVHNRPGIVTPAPGTHIGVKWEPATWKKEGEEKIVYRLTKVGNKSVRTRVGVLGEDGKIREANKIVGDYKKPGLFPEVVSFVYKQIADVWAMDNEFAAKLASWAFAREHRDLKVILAAFMLVQNRSGEPIKGTDGKVEFHDDDFRAVGEAMCLTRAKDDFNPKLIARVGDILALKGVAEINRKMGFGRSAREPAMGRYVKAVEKWLRHREKNPKMLEGLVKAGFRTTVMDLARRIGYKPDSAKFFDVLRWKQIQAKDGRRAMSIGKEVTKAETWEDLSEGDICEKIVKDKPNLKLIVGKLPKSGMTRAIMAAAIETGCLSDTDLIILTPTLEELGLLNIQAIKARWEKALKTAESQRAANIAKNVKKVETVEKLQEASDAAISKAVEEVVKGMRIYFIVDKSGSMVTALEVAKQYLEKFLQGFPLDQIHVCVFNTVGTELTLKSKSAAGVRQAFMGHQAAGGTSYAQGVKCLAHHKPKADEDSLVVFVGDEEDGAVAALVHEIQASGINPMAFGLLKVQSEGQWGGGHGCIITEAAKQLGIPCLMIEEGIFNDPYQVPRVLRNLIAATPVGKAVPGKVVKARKTLIEEILSVELLKRPLWAG